MFSFPSRIQAGTRIAGMRVNQQAPLSNDELMRRAPSVFATEPWQKMSDRYTFIPTIDVVEKMRAEGFQPYSAMQSRTRVEGKQDFTKRRRLRAIESLRRKGTRP